MSWFTRTRILGLVGVVWGAAIILRIAWTGTSPDSSTPFGAGQLAGLVFAIAMLGAGAWALRR